MPEDRPISITSSHRIRPDEVARHTFGSVRRGYDPAEVQRFLEDVARDYAALVETEAELRHQLRDAEHRAANPVLDERTLAGALGQETSRILSSAHDAAAATLARAEAEARTTRDEAIQFADETRTTAERDAAERTARAESEVADVRARIEEEARSRLDASRAEAAAMIAQARAECRSMVQQAQQLRTRVLTDLTQRRRVLHTQIEQLRAGRERLAEAIHGVRNSVDRLSDDLFRAEDEARTAAEIAGREASSQAAAWPDEEPVTAVTMGPVEAVLAGEPVDFEPHMSVEAPGTEPPVAPVTPPAFAQPEAAIVAPPTEAQAPAVAPVLEPGPPVEAPTVAPDGAEAVHDQALEDIFARLRAGRTSSTEPALASDSVEVPAEEAPVSGVTDEPAVDLGDGDEELEADADIVRRDELLRPVMQSLARRLKRALQDDQNDILDRLRHAGGWAPTVLPSVEDQERRFVDASTEWLEQAARSAAAFAGTPTNGDGGGEAEVEEEARHLAAAIVGPLRRRLEEQGAEVEGDDDVAMGEYIGAAYREWKGKRVERLAGDHVVASFSRALVRAASGSGLRWLVDDDDGDCADCDDNSLADPVKAGEPFPTGHVHPPAHPGCRCVVVICP